MKLLALDVGERRIGLASGVAEIGTALPAGVIHRTRLTADVQAVIEAASQRQSDAIVVGVPYRPNGEESPQTEYVRGFVRALRRQATLPVHEVDEVFSSMEAEGLLRDAGREPSRDKGAIDATAAVIILRRFLESGGGAS
ncbi:Putative pre-16S rRNA nuclease [Geodia barretti]|uniref:Pre-16S rRNA nuclease n=1 Tax=Geodia barretti TaxID=519541 RepID=A0AA35T225_GEOBA|nr:Putative pre-16S rRNA nuclease [Geodia barretti]